MVSSEGPQSTRTADCLLCRFGKNIRSLGVQSTFSWMPSLHLRSCLSSGNSNKRPAYPSRLRCRWQAGPFLWMSWPSGGLDRSLHSKGTGEGSEASRTGQGQDKYPRTVSLPPCAKQFAGRTQHFTLKQHEYDLPCTPASAFQKRKGLKSTLVKSSPLILELKQLSTCPRPFESRDAQGACRGHTSLQTRHAKPRKDALLDSALFGCESFDSEVCCCSGLTIRTKD